MTEFIINGKRQEIKEPWVDFVVYGEFQEPTSKYGGLIIRIPSGRVPWSKKIVPAINKLVKQWAKDHKNFYWNITGENTVMVGENFYHDTKAPIPESKRLWDCWDSFAHYEWNGKELVMVEKN